MLKVFKYGILIEDRFGLDLPKDAQILKVEMQQGAAFMWVLVDTDKSTYLRNFRLAGTGHPIDVPQEKLSYISTFKMSGGALIWHVFEILS